MLEVIISILCTGMQCSVVRYTLGLCTAMRAGCGVLVLDETLLSADRAKSDMIISLSSEIGAQILQKFEIKRFTYRVWWTLRLAIHHPTNYKLRSVRVADKREKSQNTDARSRQTTNRLCMSGRSQDMR